MAIPDLPLGVRLLIYLGTIPAIYLFFCSLSWFLDYIAIDRYVDAYRQEERFDSGVLGRDESANPLPHEVSGSGTDAEPAGDAPDSRAGTDVVACPACGAPTDAATGSCDHCDADLPG